MFHRTFASEYPCHLACRYECFEVFKEGPELYRLMIPAVRNRFGKTPLELAVIDEHFSFLTKLSNLWPEIAHYVDFWEDGGFKYLCEKYQPAFCLCGFAGLAKVNNGKI